MSWEQIIEKALSGKRLSHAEGLELYKNAPLLELGRAANILRQRKVPGKTVTYLVDRNINYSNVCTADCSFCAFYRRPGDKETYVLSREVLAKKIQETLDLGGTRILLQGGHHPDLRIEWYEDLLGWIKREFPAIAVDGFSPSEIDNMAKIETMSMSDVLARLQKAGLHGLPGGGAEILDDEVRKRISPKKQRTEGWLEAMRQAQRLGLATSASMVIGFAETLEQRMNHLDRIRALHQESLDAHGNGFTSFISWTFQPENNPLGRNEKRKEGLGGTGVDYLRNVAVSRIYLDNFDHVSASWPTQGANLAQTSLEFGCDDFGSTMIEENVVSSSGSTHSCMTPEAIRHFIRRAGYTPLQRDTRYRVVREFGPTAELAEAKT